MNTIQANLERVRNSIQEYEKRYQRNPGSVLLLAASKKQPVEKLRAAIAAGQKIFGENYLQEALEKMAELSDPTIEWHFIGPIQRNKTRKIAEHFEWVHSLDNPLIADRLNEQRPANLPPLNICIEVNVSHEASKSGVAPDKTKSLALHCQQLPRLKLRGLMTIPSISHDRATQRAEFHKLSQIYYKLNICGLNLDILSMGMSDDMEAAIAEGATIVRVGTAIFGPRI